MNGGIAERYRSVAERVARAAERSGRAPSDVVLLAVGKTFAAESVIEAVRAGCRDLGENYVQEARVKRAEVERLLAPTSAVRWHFIGRLQRNKARVAVELFDLVHSLDSEALADALDRAAAAGSRVVECLVEINLGGESTKGGIAPDRLGDFLRSVADRSSLHVRGLMAIPPPEADPSVARLRFRRLRELRDRHADLPLPGGGLKELSMGMSADYEAAIEEGATIVRVGRAIFGPRG